MSWWVTGQGPPKQGARGQGVAAELLIRPAVHVHSRKSSGAGHVRGRGRSTGRPPSGLPVCALHALQFFVLLPKIEILTPISGGECEE